MTITEIIERIEEGQKKLTKKEKLAEANKQIQELKFAVDLCCSFLEKVSNGNKWACFLLAKEIRWLYFDYKKKNRVRKVPDLEKTIDRIIEKAWKFQKEYRIKNGIEDYED